MQTFKDIPLKEEIQKALIDLTFHTPTEVQKSVLPVALRGRDFMACAETGSGKTAAYGIPMVTRLLENPKGRALILAPTRELVHQISEFLRELTAHCENIRVTSLVGGADMKKQVRALKKNPSIIVATPGRLVDHLNRKSLNLKSVENLVLDEGDRMLDIGFAKQLDQILNYLPRDRQSSLFTATLPEKVKKLATKYLNQPQSINVGRVSLPVEAIRQSVVELTAKQKNEHILDELNTRNGSIIVFVRTKRRTDALAKHLKSYGYSVDLIHGNRSQGQRNKAIRDFKSGESRILCATDIAARGIDVPSVEHVINFDLPKMHEDYVHRIGRTARNGADGEAVSFVTPQEHRQWNLLIRQYRIQNVDLKGVPEASIKQSKSSHGKKSVSKKRKFKRWEKKSSDSKPDSKKANNKSYSKNKKKAAPQKWKKAYKKSKPNQQNRSI